MCTGLMQILKATCMSGMEMSHEPCFKDFLIALQKK